MRQQGHQIQRHKGWTCHSDSWLNGCWSEGFISLHKQSSLSGNFPVLSFQLRRWTPLSQAVSSTQDRGNRGSRELSFVYRGKSLLLKQAGVLRARWGSAGEGRSALQSLQWRPGSWTCDQGFAPLCPEAMRRSFEPTGCNNLLLEILHLESFYNRGYKENQESGMIMPNCYRLPGKDMKDFPIIWSFWGTFLRHF